MQLFSKQGNSPFRA